MEIYVTIDIPTLFCYLLAQTEQKTKSVCKTWGLLSKAIVSKVGCVHPLRCARQYIGVQKESIFCTFNKSNEIKNLKIMFISSFASLAYPFFNVYFSICFILYIIYLYMASGGSSLEPAGNISVWQWGSPMSYLKEATPCSPPSCYQNLTM